jgi:4-diphosphocytidyl-2-C-methyl-D-erythritol kinase
MNEVTVAAPAKVNLELHVGRSYVDRYHELVSVIQSVSLYDSITIKPSSCMRITAEGPYGALVPLDETNLALKAVKIFRHYQNVTQPVHIHLTKNIPVAAGMAGGTADAVGTLLACRELWFPKCPMTRMEAMAEHLGYDGLFCLRSETGIVSGRGENVTTLKGLAQFDWVFASSLEGLSSAAVFREYDQRTNDAIDDPRISTAMLSAITSGPPDVLAPLLYNGLQDAVLHLRPGLDRILRFGVEVGALAGIVSGSGPTCAFLAWNREHAVDLAQRLIDSNLFYKVHVAKSPAPAPYVVDS